MRKQWVPCELHTHTVHSDAKHTLLELANSARNLGIECIALTDHNTISGSKEREEAMQQTGIQIIQGMEWTTFYGHMLTQGITKYVDWRDIGLSDIHTGIKRVHEQDGVVGIAHPFRVGSPVCTGCYWDFEVTNWNEINYIEVWSGIFPSIKNNNRRAFEWWTDLLNHGYRIGGTSGRDWHNSELTDDPIAVTYLGIHEYSNDREIKDFEKSALNAIRNGSISVTMGPLLLFDAFVQNLNKTYEIGEVIPVSNKESWKMDVQLTVDFTAREKFWKMSEQNFTVKVTSNLGELGEQTITGSNHSLVINIETSGINWMRAELYGVIQGVRTMIAFTNPIYLDHQ